MRKSINWKAFDEACEKVGLKLGKQENKYPAKGIIIKDEMGNRYNVISEKEIKKISTGDVQKRCRMFKGHN